MMELNPQQDVAALRQEASRVTDDSLEATRRMMTLCEESQDAGAKTLVMLDAQGEQLERIEEGMDQINSDMKEAEKNLTGMEKCCGLCVMPWRRVKKFREDSATWKSSKEGKDGVVTSQPGKSKGGKAGVATVSGGVPEGGQITRITNDHREDEMEDNLGQVNSMVANLRNMALDMGTELDSQNKTITRLDAKAESNAARVDEANVRTKALLKNA